MAAIQLKIFQTFKRKANFIIQGGMKFYFFYQQWLNYVAMQTLKKQYLLLTCKRMKSYSTT